MIGVTKTETLLEERSIQHQREVHQLGVDNEHPKKFAVEHGQKIIALEERIKALEKGNDRRWQAAPIATSAIVTIA